LFVAPPGVYIGQPGVQQYYENVFATVHPSADFMHDIDHVEMLSGDLAIATGHWSLSRPALKGFWSAVYEHRSGPPWAMRAHTYNIMPPAPAPQGTIPAR
jgi:ketosteroid isomerase-like protein